MKQFPLCNEPNLYQLSVHYGNHKEYYGEGSFEDDYSSYCLYGMVSKTHPLYNSYVLIANLIGYYGHEIVEHFLYTIHKQVA